MRSSAIMVVRNEKNLKLGRSTLLLLAVFVAIAAAVPAHSDWEYSRKVIIHNPSAGPLFDYQLYVMLNSSFDFDNAQADGSDLRAIAADGQTEIPFWIETWDSVGRTASLWIKVPSIPHTGTTIFLLYGNPEAISHSNGDATFEFFDGGDWGVGQEGNPVHTINVEVPPCPEDPLSWADDYVSYPNVFREGNDYYMLYDGHRTSAAYHRHQKGLLTSSSLQGWTHENECKPVVTYSDFPGAWDQRGVAWGDTVKVGDTYYMLVVGFDADNRRTIGVETSTNLVNWNREPAGATNPVLVATEDWETGGLVGGSLLKSLDGITPVLHNGQYWMAYSNVTSPYKIGLAYAAHPLGPWYKCDHEDPVCNANNNPILGPTSEWDELGIWSHSMVEDGGKYYIFYHGHSFDAGKDADLWQTGHAWSAATEFPNTATAWNENQTEDPVLHLGPADSWDEFANVDPIIRKFDDTYYLFYTGRDQHNWSGNGYATAPSIEGPFSKLGKWHLRNSPTVINGVITLGAGQSVATSDRFPRGRAVGFRANFKGSSDLYKWGGFLTSNQPPFTYIGTVPDFPRDPSELGLTNYLTSRSWEDLHLGVVNDAFRIYEVAWAADETKAYVDHEKKAELADQVPDQPLPVEFQNYNDTGYNLEVDWVYVRSYCSDEPIANVTDPVPTLSEWGLITFGMLLVTAMGLALRRRQAA